MHQRRQLSRRVLECALAFALGAGSLNMARAQTMLNHEDLDRLVGRIALYTDPLLAQVLSASTYYDQIPDAAKWSDHHHYLGGDALAAAITGRPSALGSQRAGVAAVPIGA